MKNLLFIVFITFMVFLTACNGSSSDSASEKGDSGEASSDVSQTNGLSDSPEITADSEEDETLFPDTENQMMVYQAQVELETEDYDRFYQSLQKQMDETNAYMIDTNIHKNQNGTRQGHIRMRVPQKNFEGFLSSLEKISDDILSRNISARDVTEEYVDLESRLKAKEKIEERLLTFLEQADATEDLIKISQDLERVQSEIEVIKGKMQYLQNQSDFSTVTVYVTETKVVVPNVGNSELNTWERTKQAFFQSINGISTFSSWIFVTVVGYSPLLLPLIVIIFLYWLLRRRKKSKQNRE